MERFIDECISSGKVIEYSKFILSNKTTTRIEDILNKHNDSKARTKIRKILKEIFNE